MAKRQPGMLVVRRERGRDGRGRQYFLLRFTDPDTGARVCRTLGWMTRREAEAELARVRAAMTLGLATASPSAGEAEAPPRRRWLDFVETTYLPRVKADSAPGTLDASRRALTHFDRLVGDPYLDEVTPTMLCDFEATRRAEGVSPRTVYLDTREVRLVLELAHGLGVIPGVPGVRERRRGRQLHATRVRAHDIPTPDQYRALLAAARPALRLFLLLTGRCGLREGEATSREWSDLQESTGGVVWLRIDDKPAIDWTPKTSKSRRTIPLPRDVAAALLAARPAAGGWIFPSGRGERRHRFAEDLVRLCRKVLGEAGPVFRAHAFRRYFATECARRGVALRTTMALGGWERIDTLVEVYQQADRTDLVRAVLGEEDE
ncbi:site-specific integrase [Myxococcota bacterium]|nr:site-specific integrase [Myxococcota bacterium]